MQVKEAVAKKRKGGKVRFELGGSSEESVRVE